MSNFVGKRAKVMIVYVTVKGEVFLRLRDKEDKLFACLQETKQKFTNQIVNNEIENGQFYWYSNEFITTRCKILDCNDDKNNALHKPLVYEIDTGRRKRVLISFLKGPIVVNEYFLFKCSIKRFQSFTQAQVQKLNSEFTSNSVFLAEFNSYDINEKSYTIEIYKVFSTNPLPLRLNGFLVDEYHKNNLRVLFGETESRSYKSVDESDSHGMRSDAIVKQLKKKCEREESPFIEQKSPSNLIKSDDKEMQHVPDNSKDSLSERSTNNRPKIRRFPSTSGLLSSLGQTSSQAVVFKRKSFANEHDDENQAKKLNSTNRFENFDAFEPLSFEIRDNLIDEILRVPYDLEKMKTSFGSFDEYLDCIIKLTREDYYRPLRADLVKIRTTHYHDIEYGAYFFEALTIDRDNSPKVWPKGVSISMTVRDSKFSKKIHQNDEVYLSSDNFISNIVPAVIRKINREEKTATIRLEHDCQKFDLNEINIVSVLRPSGIRSVYQNVLTSLKNLKNSKFPLENLIIYDNMNTKNQTPHYLYDQEFDIRSLLPSKAKSIHIKPNKTWPTTIELNLDEYQYEAVQHVFKHELALIQGPPGTGKTFVGRVILKLLLDNHRLNNKPILLICYTNHALDTFLEACVRDYDLRKYDLIRIGHRSTNDSLKMFNFDQIFSFVTYEETQLTDELTRASEEYGLTKSNETLQQIHHIKEKIAELEAERQHDIIINARIVAMTSSTAARYKRLLQKIACKVMLVEEAAEVPESHLVSAFSSNLKHLILIGDHVQLKPKFNCYQLDKEYELSVSMFERLLRNDIRKVTLLNQYRIRPECTELIQQFYGFSLINKKNSLTQISCIKENVFFINHSEKEMANTYGSKWNEYEADYILRLCKRLVLNEYSQKDITILSMYGKQSRVIHDKLKESNMGGIVSTTVDHFQGDENSIVILSLVRSNNDGSLGFVSVTNRICVSLSRSKGAFYCIGNFEFLAKNSKHWRNIVEVLKKKQLIGSRLSLTCQNHKQALFYVDHYNDFKNFSQGGCNKECKTRIDHCGHTCERLCHPIDRSHTGRYKCTKNCNKLLLCEHKCAKSCGHDAKYGCDCQVKLSKKIPTCQHQVTVNCTTEPTQYDCVEYCGKNLDCGHVCTRECKDCADGCRKCNEVVSIDLACAHKSTIDVFCHEASKFESSLRPFAFRDLCTAPCSSELDCLHTCKSTCGQCLGGTIHSTCQERQTHLLACGHRINSDCQDMDYVCEEMCENNCFHSSCSKLCREICASCNENCKISCKHFTCNDLCGSDCQQVACNEPCDSELQCGHKVKCVSFCGETCICPTCKKAEIAELYKEMMVEPSENDRFILLVDCGHIVEANYMKEFLANNLVNAHGERKISHLKCPRDLQIIYQSRRYHRKILSQAKVINQKKSIHLENESAKTEHLNRLLHNVSTLGKSISIEFLEAFSLAIKEKKNTYSTIEKYFYCFELSYQLALFVKYCDTFKLKGQSDKNLIQKFIRSIQSLLFNENKVVMRIDFNKKTQILMELKRLQCIYRLFYNEQIFESFPTKTALENDFSEEFRSLKTIVFDCKRFDEAPFSKTISTFEKLEKVLSPGLRYENPPSLEEVKVISQAINAKPGSYFQCKNGHIYNVDKCGGPMEMAKCSYCDETIGGTSHKLLPSNTLAPIDGATATAYPVT